MALTYDAAGNMRTGLNGRIMTWDGENRLASVTMAGVKTCYVYGPDGTRLMQFRAATANPDDICIVPATPSTAQPVTVTFAEVEIRNYRQGNAEVVLTYPHPNIRIVYTRTTAGVLASSIEYRFTDQLGSIREVVKGAVRSSVSTYEPFGMVHSYSALSENKFSFSRKSNRLSSTEPLLISRTSTRPSP